MRKNNPDEKTRKIYEKLNEIGMDFSFPKTDGTKINAKVVKIEEYKGIRIIYGDTQYKAKTTPVKAWHLYDNTYLIIRNMRALVEEMKLNPEERKCIYLHEIGHMLSENQKNSNQRCLENEIDADRYAIIECGADPSIMKSALLKSSEFYIKNQNRFTSAEVEAEQKETEARINSIEMLTIPQWGYQIDMGEPNDVNTQNDYDEQQDEIVRKNLSKYGITQAEWQAISQYKHEGYFIPSTLLHRIDIMKFNNPKYGEPMTNEEILEPQKAMDFYCNIYSAMCKVARRTRGKSEIVRVEGDLFLEELKNTGTTNSVMSFSKSEECLTEFIHDKENPCTLIANLPKDVPFLDFSLLMDDSRENEILLPPFLDVSKPKLQGSHLNRPVYRIEISQKKKGRLSNEEKEQMNKHKDLVLSSNVAQKYYDTWYQVKQQGRPLEAIMKDSEYQELKGEFFEWQDSFKQYLQLRFREIENEIFMPQLSSADIQSWGNERAKDSSFKDKVINIGKRMFDFVRNNRDDDRGSR